MTDFEVKTFREKYFRLDAVYLGITAVFFTGHVINTLRILIKYRRSMSAQSNTLVFSFSTCFLAKLAAFCIVSGEIGDSASNY